MNWWDEILEGSDEINAHPALQAANYDPIDPTIPVAVLLDGALKTLMYLDRAVLILTTEVRRLGGHPPLTY